MWLTLDTDPGEPSAANEPEDAATFPQLSSVDSGVGIRDHTGTQEA